MQTLSFFQLYRLLRNHRKLADRRDPLYHLNKVAKWVVGFFEVFIICYLLFFSVVFAIGANESSSCTSLEFMMGINPFILTLDFFIRFAIQQTPSQIVKPYVLLPIPRYTCIDVFLINSLLSSANLVWFIIWVPYCIMSVVFSYGLFATFMLLLLCYALVLVNSQWYLIARTLIANSQLWWLLVAAVYGLLALPWILNGFDGFFDFYSSLGTDLEQGNFLPLAGALLLLGALVEINRKLQYKNVRSEIIHESKTELKSVTRFRFLEKYGEVGEYLKLEVKSLLRNKNPKKSFAIATSVVILLSAVTVFTPAYDTKFMTNFWCFYDFIIYGAMYLIHIMSYEGNYISVLMVHKENILKLLLAKYYFFVALLIIPFILMLPMVFVGKWDILMLISYGIFTAGFIYFLLMQLAVYNKTKTPLNEKFISKGGIENNYVQVIIEIAAFSVPIILVSIFQSIFSDLVSQLLMMGIGIAFIATHKLWLRNIYKRMMARKYVNLEGFNS